MQNQSILIITSLKRCVQYAMPNIKTNTTELASSLVVVVIVHHASMTIGHAQVITHIMLIRPVTMMATIHHNSKPMHHHA